MNMHAAQLVKKDAHKPQDLGSSPRSPPFHIIFLSNVILCNFNTRSVPCSPPSILPRVQSQQFKGPDLEGMIHMSQRLDILVEKVKQARVDGPKLLKKNLLLGTTPP